MDINQSKLKKEYDSEIFSALSASFDPLNSHKEIEKKLKNKNPYSITVIINNLNPKLWNNKKYIEKTRMAIQSRYTELLYKYFFDEFGRDEGNELYAKWLDKYRAVWKKEKKKKELDDYIIKNELEPRYKDKILKKYKNHKRLLRPRTEISQKRYYNIPEPLNCIDWRNPYDNIFVWMKEGKKFFRRGGSGSSGGRETNSKFIYGFSLINKRKPIKSYLFLYSDDNQLYFIKEFSSLTVPRYDIGDNYFLKNNQKEKIILETNLIEWEDFNKLKKIKFSVLS